MPCKHTLLVYVSNLILVLSSVQLCKGTYVAGDFNLQTAKPNRIVGIAKERSAQMLRWLSIAPHERKLYLQMLLPVVSG